MLRERLLSCSDVSSVIGKAPLFPLPQGALLPGELLPLHIFETRYRLMLEAVRRGDRLIAIGTLLPGWEVAYEDSPPVAPVVGLGRVVRDQLNGDGTSDIVLRGLVRGEITDEARSEPFRRVTLRVRRDEEHPAVAYRLRRRLLEGLSGCLPGRLAADVTVAFDPGALADRIAVALELAPAVRVELQAALDPARRIDVLLAALSERKEREKLAAIVPSLGDFSLHLRDPLP